MFLSTVKKVKLEVRPLFLPQLVRLTTMLKPGLRSINVCTIRLKVSVFHLFIAQVTCKGK